MIFKKNKGGFNDVVNVDPRAQDASDADDLPPPPGAFSNPRGRRRSGSGLGYAWSNYKQTLSVSFNSLSRGQQESVVNRLCQVITIGVTLLVLCLFYSILPMVVRVLIVPLAIAASWWAANNIVTQTVIARLEPIFKSSEEPTDNDADKRR